MTNDELEHVIASRLKELRYSQRSWMEDAREIISTVLKNTPETGQHRLARQAAPIGALRSVGPQAAGQLHSFVPDEDYPQFCGECGYAPQEPLKHIQPL